MRTGTVPDASSDARPKTDYNFIMQNMLWLSVRDLLFFMLSTASIWLILTLTPSSCLGLPHTHYRCRHHSPAPSFHKFRMRILTLLNHICYQGRTVGKQIRLAFARGRVHFFALAIISPSACSIGLVFFCTILSILLPWHYETSSAT
jgi:hypothetical protein